MVQTRSATKNLKSLTNDKASDHPEFERSGEHVEAPPVQADHPAKPAQHSSKRSSTRKTNGKATGTLNRTNMRGKLVMLLDMNLDVLSQILSHLHPMDLLNLARLSKPFRQFLMSKSHAFVWAAARKHVAQMPACPPDLSEPEYANLAFDPHCHNCGGIVYTIYWNIRRRYCPGCRAKLLRCIRLCRDLPDTGVMLPTERLRGIENNPSREGHYVDEQQYDEVYKEYVKTPHAKRDEFVAQRREIVANMKMCVDACKRWHAKLVAAREEELADAKDARNEAIFKRLKDAGYDQEIRFMGRRGIMTFQPDVFRTSKPLTEKDWKEVFPKLEPKMIKFREQRLEREVYNPRRRQLISLYDRYIQDPAPAGETVDFLPSISDVAHFVPFDEIIKLPEGITVNEMTFKLAFDQLPMLTKKWREEIDALLASVVNIGNERSTRKSSTRNQNQRDTSSSLKERLQLACAVFEVRCSDYPKSEIFTYPRILAESTVFNSPYNGYVESRILRPWSLPIDKDSRNSVRLFPGASFVIRACGLDPQIATKKDMDRLNVRLVCTQCRNRTPEKVEVMSWKAAVDHLHRHHEASLNKPGRWSLLDKNLVVMAEAEEQRYPPSPGVPCADLVLFQPYTLPKSL